MVGSAGLEPTSCWGARRMSLATARLRPSPTPATRSGRFIRHRRRSHRSPPGYEQLNRYGKSQRKRSKSCASPLFAPTTRRPRGQNRSRKAVVCGFADLCLSLLREISKQHSFARFICLSISLKKVCRKAYSAFSVEKNRSGTCTFPYCCERKILLLLYTLNTILEQVEKILDLLHCFAFL